VALSPYGAGATRVGRVGYGTRYVSPATLRTNAAVVRGGYYGGAFTRGWYRGYPGAWWPARWRVANYWTAPTWLAVGGFIGITAAPIVYDYGSAVVIENNNVYVNGEQTVTAPQYAQQAIDFADAGREAEPAGEDEWQPLGVFGLVQGDERLSQNIFQLAVNKKGVVRGNYYDAVADNNLPVYGSVDKKSQRVAWSVGKKKTVVFEAGLNNLTQDQTTVLVHYGKDETRQLALVRLEEPKEESKEVPN
jgi:hypothetical protein